MVRAMRYLRQLITVLLLFVLAGSAAVPAAASAKEPEQKVVRVGWFDSSFCYWDGFGRRCGIAYEYQHKIAAYTGWTYEYVEDSWPNLFQMLKDGKIDLLSDVSYKPERAESMLFPELPMGTESYYIYIDAENRDLTGSRPASFNGSRIGVNEGSVQEGFLKDWAEKNSVDLEIIPLTVDEDESMDMVIRGEIDGYASIYTFSSAQKVVPVCRVGSSDYYYAVSTKRPDLLAELNMALAGIQDEDPYFNQRLSQERLYNTRTNAFLTPTQEDWLDEHGTIRIGYLDNFLPFCQTDGDTGALTGALKDYLTHAESHLSGSGIRFETQPYASVREALDAMKAGQVDCVFPTYLSSYDADEMGVWLTNPAMKSEMTAIVRDADEQGLSRDSAVTFAVDDGNLNTMTFIMNQYPASGQMTSANTGACVDAVASGKADCLLVSSYRIHDAEDLLAEKKLFSVPTGESMPLSFAVDREDRDLYFLLNKTVLMTGSEEMDSALISYMQFNRNASLARFLRDNWIVLVVAVSAVFILIIFLLFQKLKAERKAHEQQKMMEDGLRRELQQKEQLQSAMAMAYRDSLTGVKSKHAYNEAEEQMDRRIAEGSVSEFSVVVFDLNDLKVINDSRGHETGDEYIRDACRMICTCFKHSPVFRIGGDEFTAILEGEDYANQDELLERFEKLVLGNIGRNGIVVAFGCSRFDAQEDTSMHTVFERADAAMYKEKQLLKSFGGSSEEEEADSPDQVFGADDISVINVRRHILIADDVAQNREILGDLLQEDYDIYFASDGIETMEILRSHRNEVAIVLLDLHMPNMTGREVMMQMQVDEDLMSIPVIAISVDQEAELDSLRIGAMDFIPNPYPDIEIIKARISKCIELSENRDLIRRTQRDKLTELFNIDYFIRYVNRYDLHFRDTAFDAVACDINQFHEVNEQYGRQFGDLVLRSIGISLSKLVRRTGGIACRKEGDTFLLYCQHQDDYESLLKKFMDELFVDKDMAGRVSLRFGIYADAQSEPDIEERFVRAKMAADSVEGDPHRMYAFYRMNSRPLPDRP